MSSYLSDPPAGRTSPAERTPRPRARSIGHVTGRLAVLGLVTGVGLLSLAGVASAHVTAQPGSAAQGSYAKVSFRTPNEKDAANTVKLEVDFPPEHPIASVSTEPLPGWTAAVEKTKLATPIKTDDGDVSEAVSKITWTGGALTPGQFEDFSVSLGPLPSDSDKLVFKALQTYSDGDVVRWIEEAQPGAPEPEHPAPTLTLTKSGETAPEASGMPTGGSAGGPTGSANPGGSGAALVIGVIGLVLGLLGTVLGGLALRRRGSAG